jgi:hypothetical protein
VVARPWPLPLPLPPSSAGDKLAAARAGEKGILLPDLRPDGVASQ